MKIAIKIFSTFSFAIIFLLVTSFFGKKKEIPLVKIDALKMDVMYYGLDNPISVVVSNIDQKNIIVTSAGGMIAKDKMNEQRYIVRPDSLGKNVVINVSVKKGKITAFLFSQTFRVKEIPDPNTMVLSGYGTYASGDAEFSVDQVANIHGVYCSLSNFDFDCKMSIVSFMMSANIDGKWKDCIAHGPTFTEEMKYELKNVKPGDRIFFHDVNEVSDDGIVRKISGVTITVK